MEVHSRPRVSANVPEVCTAARPHATPPPFCLPNLLPELPTRDHLGRPSVRCTQLLPSDSTYSFVLCSTNDAEREVPGQTWPSLGKSSALPVTQLTLGPRDSAVSQTAQAVLMVAAFQERTEPPKQPSRCWSSKGLSNCPGARQTQEHSVGLRAHYCTCTGYSEKYRASHGDGTRVPGEGCRHTGVRHTWEISQAIWGAVWLEQNGQGHWETTALRGGGPWADHLGPAGVGGTVGRQEELQLKSGTWFLVWSLLSTALPRLHGCTCPGESSLPFGSR